MYALLGVFYMGQQKVFLFPAVSSVNLGSWEFNSCYSIK